MTGELPKCPTCGMDTQWSIRQKTFMTFAELKCPESHCRVGRAFGNGTSTTTLKRELRAMWGEQTQKENSNG